jgi:5-oxoprolinase (ATP-hydrolysing)
VDPVLLELNNLFAERRRAGLQLQNTTRSTSGAAGLQQCLVWPTAGNRLPMPARQSTWVPWASIKTVIAQGTRAQPVAIYASIFYGGTHLPNITVITPVYLDGSPRPNVLRWAPEACTPTLAASHDSMPPFPLNKRVYRSATFFAGRAWWAAQPDSGAAASSEYR